MEAGGVVRCRQALSLALTMPLMSVWPLKSPLLALLVLALEVWMRKSVLGLAFGPAVKSLCFHCRGHGLIPSQLVGEVPYAVR